MADTSLSTTEPCTALSQRRRQNEGGLLVTGADLSGYAPAPPSKKPRESWIWKHGEALIRDSDYSLVWLCKICHADSVHHPHKDYILAAASTTPARRHMERHGFDLKGQQMHRGLKRRAGSLLDYVDRQHTADHSTFNEKGWIDAFVRWAVTTNQSLRQASSQSHLFLLTFQNPRLENLVPTSANTIRDWIMQAASGAKEKIEKSFSRAASSITISFDNWTADNGLDFLGVTAHYLDASLCPRAILLGLRDTRGSHSGESIAEEVLRVINDFDIAEKVEYFMADNATANDRAIRVLSGSLDIDPEHDRLRCGAHVINLVAKAVLYGTDNDAIDQEEREDCLSDSRHVAALEAVVRSEPLEEALQTWRRKGPVGKLHNLVTHIQKTPKRRRFFEMKQNVDADADDGRIYRVIVNGGIRWNSSCDMIERAMKLRDALELYQTHFRSLSDSDRLSSSDCLDAADWSEMERLLEVLSPLKHASLRLQADNDTKHALWEQLATFDSLLGECEQLRERYRYEPSSHIKACINLGWKKLDKYYGLSDKTSAYRLAIFLHPHPKMAWFERHWGCRPAWIDAAKAAIDGAYSAAKARWPLDAQ
ncbi:hypothetical protein KC353_g629, partial [Hortaea werneckii]